MGNSEKIFFSGGERIDWALNEDLRLLQSAFPGLERAANIVDANIVHSVWWGGVLSSPPEAYDGKKVICQFDNPPFHWVGQPSFRDARKIVGLWVAQNHQAELEARTLGLNCTLVPYKVNTEIFRPHSKESKMEIRRALNIAPEAYVIGNFHRDSDGSDLRKVKLQKGADFFLEIVAGAKKNEVPVHVLLAGPRRHWLREQLRKRNIPFTYVGKETATDDIKINILPRTEVARLYGALDLCLVSSRWEGGPYSLLEAAATKTPVLTTPVGVAPDLIEPFAIFENLEQASQKLADRNQRAALSALSEKHFENLQKKFTLDATKPYFSELLKKIESMPVYSHPTASTQKELPRERPFLSRMGKIFRREKSVHDGLTVSFFREFVKPPYGGGNQFMLALKSAFEKKGVRVLVNEVSDAVDGYFFDSLWFDQQLLKKLEKIPNPTVIHRIDGPIHLYRGKDKHLDDEIFAINSRLANSSVIQSNFTLQKIFETGYRPIRPVVIRNAADNSIFFPKNDIPTLKGKKIRLIASSWSDNPNKGGPIYRWLEQNLDWNKYDFTFVGRCSETLLKANTIGPIASEKLADTIREHDIYITASVNDPCSNALIEAMSCGLPAVALKSGGHPELVGFGGICFEKREEILPALNAIAENYDSYRNLLQPPNMNDVAEKYLSLVKAR